VAVAAAAADAERAQLGSRTAHQVSLFVGVVVITRAPRTRARDLCSPLRNVVVPSDTSRALTIRRACAFSSNDGAPGSHSPWPAAHRLPRSAGPGAGSHYAPGSRVPSSSAAPAPLPVDAPEGAARPGRPLPKCCSYRYKLALQIRADHLLNCSPPFRLHAVTVVTDSRRSAMAPKPGCASRNRIKAIAGSTSVELPDRDDAWAARARLPRLSDPFMVPSCARRGI
jgi:hypothetical protein